MRQNKPPGHHQAQQENKQGEQEEGASRPQETGRRSQRQEKQSEIKLGSVDRASNFTIGSTVRGS